MRWSLRRARTWLIIGAAVAAPVLASRDQRTGWTVTVGVVTAALAVAAIAGDYRAAHPDAAERRAARMQAEVDAILARYESERARRRSEGGT